MLGLEGIENRREASSRHPLQCLRRGSQRAESSADHRLRQRKGIATQQIDMLETQWRAPSDVFWLDRVALLVELLESCV